MALVDAQMVGGMRRTMGTDGLRFDVDAFRPLGPEAVDELSTAAERYGRFLGLPADLRVRSGAR